MDSSHGFHHRFCHRTNQEQRLRDHERADMILLVEPVAFHRRPVTCLSMCYLYLLLSLYIYNRGY